MANLLSPVQVNAQGPLFIRKGLAKADWQWKTARMLLLTFDLLAFETLVKSKRFLAVI